MTDPVRDAWGEVAASFSSLGRAMRERYRGEGSESPRETTSAAEDALRESFERFVAAGRDVGQRTVDVVRDETVNDQARHAASSLNDALSATAEMIGREVAGWFGRSSGESPGDDDQPTVVGVPDDVPDAARPSVTGLVTDSPDTAPGVDVADVDPGHGTTTPPS